MRELALKIPGAGGGQVEINPPNVPDFNSTNTVLGMVLSLLFALGVVAAIIMLVYAGIMWATSGGDKQKIETAHSTITYSIVGLIVILLSFFIVQFIGSLIGVNLIRLITR